MTALVAPSALAWRFFDTTVAEVTRLSPSYVRLTLTGSDLDRFADNGWDQRFKLVLPDRHGSYDDLPRDPDWYAAWRHLPEDRRNPIRTYTVRAARPTRREVDVDLVLHGDGGPASRFAAHALPGDRLVVLGPNADHHGAHGGVEFRPPEHHEGSTLLVGDVTAVPAVLSVLEHLPRTARGEAVLEVPHLQDARHVAAPAGCRMTWVASRPGGSRLPAAVDDALGRLGIGDGGRPRDGGRLPPGPGEPGEDLVWEVPTTTSTHGLYAWIAGESSVVTGLRRRLVRDLGVDRGAVAFMGYWRRGRASG